MKRLSLLLGLPVLTMSLSGLTPATAVKATTTCPSGQAAAASHWDAFRASRAEVAACDLVQYPLESVSALPDGGASWTYATPGGGTEMNVPPTGFDALTATDAERSLYGLPAEPPVADSAAHAAWVDHLAHVKNFVAPPPYLLGLPGMQSSFSTPMPSPFSTSYTYSNNWSGYYDVEYAGYFHYATGLFTQPTDTTSHCTYRDAEFWVGIGGVLHTNELGQAGTFLGNQPGLNEDQAWYESLPKEGTIALNMYATPGYDFEVDVKYSNGGYYYTLTNYYNDNATALFDPETTFDGGTTDFIAERPFVNGSLTNLANYVALYWNRATSAIQQNPISAYPNHNVTMTSNGQSSGGDLMATANALGGGGYTFTDTQHSCF